MKPYYKLASKVNYHTYKLRARLTGQKIQKNQTITVKRGAGGERKKMRRIIYMYHFPTMNVISMHSEHIL